MTGKHPRGAAGENDHVETYQLPRWDAQGKLVKKPATRNRPQQSEAEDVNPESLRPPTASDIRQIHEDAYNEGFESGFEQGMKQGQATGQSEGYKAGFDSGEQEGRSAGHNAGKLAAEQEESSRISQELAPLAKLFADIKQILPEQSRDLEAGLVTLATRIARNVIDAELALNPEHINELVHAAVQALPNADERFTLEINPDDATYVNRVAEPHWNIVPTPSVSRGGCLIRTRFSYVDYSLEHRYRQQVSNLLAHVGLSEQLTELEKPWPLPAHSEATVADTTADLEASGEEESTPQENAIQAEEGVEQTAGTPVDGAEMELDEKVEVASDAEGDTPQASHKEDSDASATGDLAEGITQADETARQPDADETEFSSQDDTDER